MMNRSSASLMRRGRPPAHRGSRQASPIALNRWITSRTVSSSAATRRAIAGTGVPLADAMIIIARRTRIVPCFPRRTICNNRRPSSSVNRRARTGPAMTLAHLSIAITRYRAWPCLQPACGNPPGVSPNPANVHGHPTSLLHIELASCTVTRYAESAPPGDTPGKRPRAMTPLLGRFMLAATWANMREHTADPHDYGGSRGRGFKSRRPDSSLEAISQDRRWPLLIKPGLLNKPGKSGWRVGWSIVPKKGHYGWTFRVRTGSGGKKDLFDGPMT